MGSPDLTKVYKLKISWPIGTTKRDFLCGLNYVEELMRPSPEQITRAKLYQSSGPTHLNTTAKGLSPYEVMDEEGCLEYRLQGRGTARMHTYVESRHLGLSDRITGDGIELRFGRNLKSKGVPDDIEIMHAGLAYYNWKGRDAPRDEYTVKKMQKLLFETQILLDYWLDLKVVRGVEVAKI